MDLAPSAGVAPWKRYICNMMQSHAWFKTLLRTAFLCGLCCGMLAGHLPRVLGQTRPTLHLDVLRFSTPGAGPYIEVQAEIVAALGSGFPSDEAFAELTVIATRGEEILAFGKTSLRAEAGDSIHQALGEHLLHIERLPVTAGAVSLEVQLKSIGVSPEWAAFSETTTLPVEVPHAHAPWFSDIMILEAYKPSESLSPLARSGFDMLPIVGSTLSEQATDIPFYAELYGTHEIGDSLFLLTAEWIDGEGHPIPGTTRFFRKQTAEALPIFERMSLSGTEGATPPLRLHLSAKTRNGDPIADRLLPVQFVDPQSPMAATAGGAILPFIASFTDSLALMRHIEDHHPRGNHSEQQFIDYVLPQVDVRQMQAFLDGFWRNHAPNDPELGWRDYTRSIAYVDSTYGACRRGRGARTDMGYVYLRYGPPNTIVQRHNETDYYPYEIWHYHKTLDGQTNKRILYMCPSAVAECFDMLHTDIRGEIFNPDWLTMLRTRENRLRVTDSQTNRLNPRQNTFSQEEPEDLFFNPR